MANLIAAFAGQTKESSDIAVTASFGNLLANVSSEVFEIQTTVASSVTADCTLPTPKKITNEDGEVQVGRLLRITQKTNGGSSADNDIVFPDASGSNITLTQDAAAESVLLLAVEQGYLVIEKNF